MADPGLRRRKASTSRETDPDTVRLTAVEVERIGLTIPVDICVLDLVWCRLAILNPHLCRLKADPFGQADPNASTSQRVEVERVGCSISIEIGRASCRERV